MSDERETRRDCPVCGLEDSLSFYAEYENDPDVGIGPGYGVELRPEQLCSCRLSGAEIRRLEEKVSLELYDDMGSELEP